MDINEIKDKKRGPKEAVVFNIIVLACVVVVVLLMGVLHVGAWVPFVALCLWAMKITVEPKAILKSYIGAAVGLAMGYLLQNAGTLGTWALVVFVIGVLCLFLTMLNHIPGMTFFFNDWTAVFTSIGTAMPYTLGIYIDWLFAFILFGVSVMIAGYFMGRKKPREQETAPAQVALEE